MQVLALPHPHSTALLAEITPFDPEEDELDGYEAMAGSDTGGEQWWVPGEAAGGVGGRACGVQGKPPAVACSPRRAGTRVLSWLVQGFERMVPQPEMLKKPEVSAAQLGVTGGCQAEVTAERAPCPHPPTCSSWDLGEENPRGVQQSKRKATGCCSLCSLTSPHAGGDPPFGTHWCQQCRGLV